MAGASWLALGLDFGTESVRALLIDESGRERGSAVVAYSHGQIIDRLPTTGVPLPPHYALQHPGDWLPSAAQAVRAALSSGNLDAAVVIGIGVDFTSCTMLPTRRDGTPLCQCAEYEARPLAWPKLWKHHGAVVQTERINNIAQARNEPWLARYGGRVGLEWLFPKILETIENDPQVAAAAEVWLEAGDWFVWQLVGGEANDLPRSTCQAGYKALWHRRDGYPPAEFLAAVHPELVDVAKHKLPGRMLSPGECAGTLSPRVAEQFSLLAGIPVSAAVIDAHAGVPGAGVADAGTLVMVLGTSSCHMLNACEERLVPGVAGIVEGGILPGYFGYETGQAAVGDAFDWLRRLVGQTSFEGLDEQAARIAPGADGVLCLDWFNGCRTPLMDGSLTGAFTGLSLRHGPAHLYRAALEASALGLRWIVDVLREGGVPVERFVATGGLPHHNPLLVQIYADVLDAEMVVHPSRQGPALGAAILGVLAAGRERSGFASASDAIHALAAPRDEPGRRALVVAPNGSNRRIYDDLYGRYRRLAQVAITDLRP